MWYEIRAARNTAAICVFFPVPPPPVPPLPVGGEAEVAGEGDEPEEIYEDTIAGAPE